MDKDITAAGKFEPGAKVTVKTKLKIRPQKSRPKDRKSSR